ncbi:MAG: molybdenum cofactor guanylyltransferase, partial [Ardenticatenaceae bacterium]
PFLNVGLLRYLASVDLAADVVVPVIAEDGYPETLHAIYGQGALPAIEAQLAQGQRKITSFFPQVRVRYVQRDELVPFDPGLRSFVNANTPEEWAAALRGLE